MGAAGPADVELAACIVARFGQGRDAEKVRVSVTTNEGLEQVLEVVPMAVEAVSEAWYL